MPEWKERQREGVRRAKADPKRLATMREVAKRNGKAPGATEKRRETALRIKLWEKGHAALEGNTDARARAGAKRTAKVLAHIPREKRDDYRLLVRSKGFTAEEASEMVLAAHEREMERWRREIGAKPGRAA